MIHHTEPDEVFFSLLALKDRVPAQSEFCSFLAQSVELRLSSLLPNEACFLAILRTDEY